jgi:hypothetical protein
VKVHPEAKDGVNALCKAVSRCSAAKQRYRDATEALYTAHGNATRAARASKMADNAVIRARKKKEAARSAFNSARLRAHLAYLQADVSEQSCSDDDSDSVECSDNDSDGDSNGS